MCSNGLEVWLRQRQFKWIDIALRKLRISELVKTCYVQRDATLQANKSQHCWMSHVASVCTPCFILLLVVGSCCAKFETGQTLSYVQTDPTTWSTMLRLFARGLRMPLVESRISVKNYVALFFQYQQVTNISAPCSSVSFYLTPSVSLWLIQRAALHCKYIKLMLGFR